MSHHRHLAWATSKEWCSAKISRISMTMLVESTQNPDFGTWKRDDGCHFCWGNRPSDDSKLASDIKEPFRHEAVTGHELWKVWICIDRLSEIYEIYVGWTWTWLDMMATFADMLDRVKFFPGLQSLRHPSWVCRQCGRSQDLKIVCTPWKFDIEYENHDFQKGISYVFRGIHFVRFYSSWFFCGCITGDSTCRTFEPRNFEPTVKKRGPSAALRRHVSWSRIEKQQIPRFTSLIDLLVYL